MPSIYDDAWTGTLKEESLRDYLKPDPKFIDSVGTPDGKATRVTPLIAAVWKGHLDVVKLLLKENANPNLHATRYTPLYYATVRHGAPTASRLAIVRALLDAKADVNSCSNKPDDYTPLMNAIAEIRDAEVVHELLDRGASTTDTRDGKSAKDLAKQWNMERDLQPRDVRNASRGNIIFRLVAIVQVVVGWANAKMGGALSKLLGLSGIQKGIKNDDPNAPQPAPTPSGVAGVQDPTLANTADELTKVVNVDNPTKPAEFAASIGNYVAESGLDKFFAPGDPFLERLALKAAALRADPNSNLGRPENIQRLTRLSMYQPVIYCDDSGSMRRGTRWNDLKELVNRISRIATTIVPDDFGVELRFINSNNQGSFTASQMEEALKNQPGPQGGTNIGTNLESKILEPLVYSHLKTSPPTFKRPLLICTITDGHPDPEPRGKLQEVISACRDKLVDADYEPTVVKFLVSQIGDDEEAAEFLSKLAKEDDIQDVLQCTTDRLDAQLKDLKGNENRLEEWLLKVLTGPIMDYAGE